MGQLVLRDRENLPRRTISRFVTYSMKRKVTITNTTAC